MRFALGRPEAPLRLWAAAERLREEIGAPPEDAERARYEPLVAKARDALGKGAFARVWAESRKLMPERALEA